MSNTVIGNVTAVGLEPWHEIDRSDLDADRYGINTLTRIYSVRMDSVQAFLLAFRKGTMDLTFPWLYVTQQKGNVTGVPFTFTVVFKGALIENGANPNDARNVQETGGQARMNVTLQALATTTDQGPTQKQVTYEAPWSEFKYITIQHPQILGRRFPGVVNANQLVAPVITTDGSFGDYKILQDFVVGQGQLPIIPLNPPIFIGFLKVDGPKFDFEQMGNVWQVIERNQLLIVDFKVMQANLAFNW